MKLQVIKVSYQVLKSVILLDGLLYNRFLFNLSNTVVAVPEEEEQKKEIIEHFPSIYSSHMVLYMEK